MQYTYISIDSGTENQKKRKKYIDNKIIDFFIRLEKYNNNCYSIYFYLCYFFILLYS